MIIAKLMGGLGNQMFQYAAGLAAAKRNNTALKLDPYYLYDKSKRSFRFCPRDYGLDIFEITATLASPADILHFTMPRVMNKYIYHALNRLYPQRHVYPEEKYSFEDVPAHAYMTGYWQKAKILEYIDKDLRKEFTLKKDLISGCEEIEEMIRNSENPVCVSFRRGDYVGHPTLDIVTLEYYQKAVDILRRISPAPKQFFVFSDDIPWCEKNFRLNKPAGSAENETLYFVDQRFTGKKFQNYFYLMMLCRNFIIPNSTYPFWAAYLSTSEKKRVIAPAVWFKGQKADRNDILPADFMAL